MGTARWVAFLLVTFVLAMSLYHVWLRGEGYRERIDLLTEQTALRTQLTEAWVRYGALTTDTLSKCQGSIRVLARRLGVDPDRGEFLVTQALTQAGGMGGGDEPVERAKKGRGRGTR